MRAPTTLLFPYTTLFRSCSGGASFSRNPLAPASIASSAYSSRSNVVSTMTFWSSLRSSSSEVAAIPSITGIRTSMRTTSAARTCADWMASCPLDASPVTRKSSREFMSMDSPERMSCWSSTMATLIGCMLSILIRQVGVNAKSTGGFRPGGKRAVIQGSAFSHSHQALAGVIGFGGTDTVVFDRDRDPGVAPLQHDVGFCISTGVAGDVGQGFLNDAVQHQHGPVGEGAFRSAGFGVLDLKSG